MTEWNPVWAPSKLRRFTLEKLERALSVGKGACARGGFLHRLFDHSSSRFSFTICAFLGTECIKSVSSVGILASHLAHVP